MPTSPRLKDPQLAFLRGVSLGSTLLLGVMLMTFTAWVYDYEFTHGNRWNSRGMLWLTAESSLTLLLLAWVAFRAQSRGLQVFTSLTAALTAILFLAFHTT